MCLSLIPLAGQLSASLRYPSHPRPFVPLHRSLSRFSLDPHYQDAGLPTRNQSSTQQQMALSQSRITNTKSILDLAIIFQLGLHVASVLLLFFAHLVLTPVRSGSFVAVVAAAAAIVVVVFICAAWLYFRSLFLRLCAVCLLVTQRVRLP